MSIHFYPLAIKEIRKETPDCISVLFDVPEKLQENFVFTQGQNLTLKATINNEEIRRSYSICSSPLDKQLRVAIKKVDDGLFSRFANEQLKPGDVLDVMQPSGKFYTPLNPQHKKHYVAFAAGSGITPVLSLAKATLQVEPFSTFTLVYGNRSRSSIIFFEELEALKNKYMQRFNLVHILSRERTDADINFGRITEDKLAELSKVIDYTTVDEFFLCGPEEMIFCVKDFLETSGTDKKKIHFELFTTQGQKLSSAKNQHIATVAPSATCNIIIKLDGRSITFNQPLNSETTILDAALKQGADLPYACKGGMCCTCKAKLLEGEVDMDVHWGLEDEEINEGFILTCQSHPKTEKVVIDFDVR
jgi:ring-1,2-phenylacetyl-CoA epoxidase subunit PaaE